MPRRLRRICNYPTCHELTTEAYCEDHRREKHRHDKPRPSAARRGYGRKWRAARKAYLRDHPLCVACKARGRPVRASEVDHVKPHRGDPELFWDSDNWQALCKGCHSGKTNRERGTTR